LEARPEDAITLEEFQARYDAELARISGPGAYQDQAVTLGLAIAFAGADAFYCYRASEASGAATWGLAAAALLFTAFAVAAVAMIKVDVLTGSRYRKRRAELARLRTQWQARAEAGEVPRTL
jgi:hypothetical protein